MTSCGKLPDQRDSQPSPLTFQVVVSKFGVMLRLYLNEASLLIFATFKRDNPRSANVRVGHHSKDTGSNLSALSIYSGAEASFFHRFALEYHPIIIMYPC
jgi:hypothetical protein